MNARQPAAHMEQRRRLEIKPAGITKAKATGRDQRTQKWQANLSAMIVPCQHQIKALRLGPGKLVGSVGEEDSEGSALGDIGRFAKPGQFSAGQQDLYAINRQLARLASEIGQPGIREHLTQYRDIGKPSFVI